MKITSDRTARRNVVMHFQVIAIAKIIFPRRISVVDLIVQELKIHCRLGPKHLSSLLGCTFAI